MTPPFPPILHFHEPSRRYYHASPTPSNLLKQTFKTILELGTLIKEYKILGVYPKKKKIESTQRLQTKTKLRTLSTKNLLELTKKV
jgi:hypothetical protein